MRYELWMRNAKKRNSSSVHCKRHGISQRGSGLAPKYLDGRKLAGHADFGVIPFRSAWRSITMSKSITYMTPSPNSRRPSRHAHTALLPAHIRSPGIWLACFSQVAS